MGFIDNFLRNMFGSKADRDVRRTTPTVEQIKVEYAKLATITHDQLREKSAGLRQKVRDYVAEEQALIDELKIKAEEILEDDEKEDVYHQIDKIEVEIKRKIEEVLLLILPQAFAIVKDTARRFFENPQIVVTANDFDRLLATRYQHISIEDDKAIYQNKWIAGGNIITWDMIHYDSQLMGGVVLHEGKIAEMATGEGKTLVATLPVFLNALADRGVHIVTVNDYLAKRDSEWMGPLYEFHGLSVDCIDKHQPNSEERRKAYAADITFGTNNEFGFDYLRDNMAISPEDLVQRGHHYTIVDEVDSVLVDDARTPLIISGPVPKGEKQLFDQLKPKVINMYNAQKKLVSQLLVDAKRLIKEGNTQQGGILLLRAFKGLPKNSAIIKFLSEQGMKALMLKTEDVYLAENMKRMPEITDELYFVIEEKQNSVDLTERGIDLISRDSDDHSFFVLPDIGNVVAEIEKLNLTPIEKIERKEILLNDYAIKSERVHTIQQLLKAYTLFEKDIEYVVMDNKVKIVDEQTGRILDGRRYSDGLHQAIEAKEGVKVEAATQTFATVTLQNYFRMYHKLAGMTGTAETEAGELWDIYKLDVVVVPTNKPITRDDREDLIYRTRREKFNAVIEEIQSLTKAGRPILVGTTSVETSEMLSRRLRMMNIPHNVLNAKQHQREAEVVAEAGKSSVVTIATNMAGRGTDIKLSADVRKAGGLAIIGTERHESRRVDRQLRGRAGRQGDPGTSQFFVSLEDDLMRMFGSDRIAKIMDTLGLREGEVIQHRLITKSIERAQKKVEENNFGIRKRLLEYDDAMNKQREVIYSKRKNALLGERISIDIANMMYDAVESVVYEYHGKATFNEFGLEVLRIFSIDLPIVEHEYLKLNPNEIIERIYQSFREHYRIRTEMLRKQAATICANVYKNVGKRYRNVVVVFSDGNNEIQVVVDIKKAYETEGRELIKNFEKYVLLRTIDELWKEHLREMDELRHSVQNATYEQKDPLLIYKLESFELFKKMIDKNNKLSVSTLSRGHIQTREEEQIREAQEHKRMDLSKLSATKDDIHQQMEQASASSGEQEKVQTYKRDEKKIGRNELCPCGSGKKYKQCHGK